MKAKGLIISLVLLVLAVGGYFIASSISAKQVAADEEETAEGMLFKGASSASINHITYLYQGETYEFVLDGENWLYPADENFPLKQRLVREMAEAIEKNYYVETIKSGVNLADYGLDNPQCIVSAESSDGAVYRLNIGNYSTLPRGYYATVSGDDTIYIVNAKQTEKYLLDLPGLAQQDATIYVKNDNVLDIRFTDSEETYTFTHYMDGVEAYYDQNIKWFLDNNEGTLIAGNNDAIRGALNSLNNMENKGVAFYPYSEADLSQYGLEDGGIASIRIHYTDEDGVEQVRELEMGSVNPDNPNFYSYFHVVGSELICYARTEDLAGGMLCGKDSLLSKDICVVNYEDIFEMDLTIDGTNYLFTSEKENAVDQYGYDVVNSTYFLNGKETSSEYFSTMVSGFISIDAEAFADDGDAYDNVKPYIRIVYTTYTMDHEVVEFVPYNDNFYLARFNGRNDMLISVTSVRLAINRLDNLLANDALTNAAA